MSRTYKDIKTVKHRRSSKARWETEFYEYEYTAYKRDYDYDDSTYTWKYTTEEYTSRRWLHRPGVLTKKKRNTLSFQYLWYRTTPSHWVRESMTVPKRAKCRNWEKKAVSFQDVEDIPICPDFGRKPHVYYW